MEILTVSEINPNPPSLFRPNSPSREKSQPKHHSKHNQLAKIPSNLQYVPKKPSSISVEPKPDSSSPLIPNTTNNNNITATSSVAPAANTVSPPKATKIPKAKKTSKKAAAKKKVSTQTSSSSSTPSEPALAQNNIKSSNSNPSNNNIPRSTNSPKKTRAPLSTIYDSTSNTPKRAEYRPVAKKNSPTALDRPEENASNKLLILPTISPPKPNTTPQSTPISLLAPEPLPAQVLLDTTPPSSVHATVDEPSSLGPVNQPPKPRKVYTKDQILAIGRLPICSVPHSGRSPAEIIEEYNIQYAQQEKEYAKLLEEEKLLWQPPNYFPSNYPFPSASYDPIYPNLSNPINYFMNNGNKNSFRSCSVDGLNNSINNNFNFHNFNNPVFSTPQIKKTAWVPRRSADSINIPTSSQVERSSSSPDTLNFTSPHLEQPPPPPQPRTAQRRDLSKSYNSYYLNNPNYYGNNNNNVPHTRDYLIRSQVSPPYRPQVIHSTEYDEADQNEYSDEEAGGEGDLIRYSIQEINPKRLESRQKQIDIGKNTPGYKNYIQLVKKEKRKYYDPHTPDKYQICSKRSWDGQIRVWRRLLHLYDSKKTETETETKKE